MPGGKETKYGIPPGHAENPHLRELGERYPDLYERVERYFLKVMRLVEHRDPMRRELAEDGSMEVFKRACVNLSRRSEDQSIRDMEAFVKGIARRYWAKELLPALVERMRREIPLVAPQDGEETEGWRHELIDPSADMDSMMELREVVAAMHELPHSERRAMELRIEGFTAEQAVEQEEGIWTSAADFYEDVRRAKEAMRQMRRRCEEHV